MSVSWSSTASSPASPPSLAPLEPASIHAESSDAWWLGDGTCNRELLRQLASASCSEVVVFARLGDDLEARHAVLELAAWLTRELLPAQPSIRVLFAADEREPGQHATVHAAYSADDASFHYHTAGRARAF